MLHVVPVSGGKDSTAVALRLCEIEPRDYVYLITPTGNELPETVKFWDELETLLGKRLTRVTNGTLESWIRHFKALPNNRQRWCTRLLKIEPCLAWVRAQTEPVTLYVGLRADEEAREGIYSKEVLTDFPLRRWGWFLADVLRYLAGVGVTVPERNDCAWCYDQTQREWKQLWRRHPGLYLAGEGLEEFTGATFRSPSRDALPAPLVQLRGHFERGGGTARDPDQAELFEDQQRCRVCRL